MNWNKEIEVYAKDGKKTLVPLAEIEEILLDQLTKEKMEVRFMERKEKVWSYCILNHINLLGPIPYQGPS